MIPAIQETNTPHQLHKNPLNAHLSAVAAIAKRCLSHPPYATLAFSLIGGISVITGTSSIPTALAIVGLGILIDLRLSLKPSPPPFAHPLGWPDPERRQWVKMDTFQRVCRRFNLTENEATDTYFTGKKKCHKLLDSNELLHVHRWINTNFSENEEYLFGKFDVLCNPISMDYNEHWVRVATNQKPFYLHHAAAIAIDSFNREAYLNDTRRLFEKILYAQNGVVKPATDKMKHIVWFPFGMGTDLQRLAASNPEYADVKASYALRLELARTFFSALAEGSVNLYVHLCLPNDGENQNYAAFAAALSERPSLESRVLICPGVDAAIEAQRLANKYGDFTVSLVNNADRSLIGGRWFGPQADCEMDENLHRRSSLAATYAFFWNQG